MKKTIGYILLGCLLNISCKNAEPKKDLEIEKAPLHIYSKLCDTPLYSDKLRGIEGYQCYFDYDQALRCAQHQHKVLMAFFTSHSMISCRLMESLMERDKEIKRMIEENCIVAYLFCDDKGLDKNGKEIGARNMELEIKKFDRIGPCAIFINNKEQIVGEAAYNSKKEDFLKILNAAIAANNN